MKKGERATFVLAPSYGYGDAGSPPTIPAGATLTFDVELLSWKSVRDIADGVTKTVVAEGGGWKTPQARDVVRVNLTLKGEDGATLVDMQGAEFELDTGAPGAGVATALKTMKKGEKAALALAAPHGPAGAAATGDLELLSWQAVEDVVPGVVKKTITETESWAKPTPGSTVRVKVTGRVAGADPASPPFLGPDADLEFVVDEEAVPVGLDEAVRKMGEGETAVVSAAAAAAYGAAGDAALGVPPGAAIEWTVTLVSMDKAKESWEMDEPEKLAAAAAQKGAGNAHYKAGAYAAAAKRYARAASFIEYDSGFSAETKAAAADLKKACALNIAAARVKLGDWAAAAAAATQVLDKDSSNAKALFRRAQARLGLQEYVEAGADIRAALALDPASADLRALLARHRKESAAYDKQSRAAFANMFGRMAKLEAAEAKAAGNKNVVEVEAPAPMDADVPEVATT